MLHADLIADLQEVEPVVAELEREHVSRARNGELDDTAVIAIESVDVCAVGDGANDKYMLKESGLGVGHHPKPTLMPDCDLVIKYTDLTTILYAMGLKETRFVTA